MLVRVCRSIGAFLETGSIVSVIVTPYSVGIGPAGAVFGLVGVLFVEAFQRWQIEPRPWLNFFKVIVCCLTVTFLRFFF